MAKVFRKILEGSKKVDHLELCRVSRSLNVNGTIVLYNDGQPLSKRDEPLPTEIEYIMHEVAIAESVHYMNKGNRFKYMRYPEMSLQARAIQWAQKKFKKGERLLHQLKDGEDFTGHDWSDMDLKNEFIDERSGNIVDCIGVVTTGIERMNKTPSADWEDEENFLFVFCLRKVERDYLKSCRIVITTSSMIGSDAIRTDFGERGQGNSTLGDEMSKETDANALMALHLTNASKGLIFTLAGDSNQLQLMILSAYEVPRKNEFAGEVTNSLLDRATESGYSVVHMRASRRMHKRLLEWLHSRNYSGMTSAKATSTHILADKEVKGMEEFTGHKGGTKIWANLTIQVKDSE